MSIKLELDSSIESGLLAQAEARGLSLEAYAQQVLTERGNAAQLANVPTIERLRAFDEFIQKSESRDTMPEETFHRESWYPDRG